MKTNTIIFGAMLLVSPSVFADLPLANIESPLDALTKNNTIELKQSLNALLVDSVTTRAHFEMLTTQFGTESRNVLLAKETVKTTTESATLLSE